jgi:hypothetical protein
MARYETSCPTRSFRAEKQIVNPTFPASEANLTSGAELQRFLGSERA